LSIKKEIMESIIETFYSAFAQKDAETMTKCYHDSIVFTDPAFGTLHGERAKNMWKMLCESQREKEFVIRFDEIQFDQNKGQAAWEAIYFYGKKGRKVHNSIQAKFEFKDGLIIRHTDHFDLWKWSRQALGPVGFILGWAPSFRHKLQAQTKYLLDKFEAGKAS
jgi:ketosteroid isomerase-like protein